MAAVIMVATVYGVIACTADSELGSRSAADDYYNRLIDGFERGKVSLEVVTPPGLAKLSDPYDSVANGRFRGDMYMPGRIHDLSYYKGKFYLYFSVVPAVTLFLPIHLLTHNYISHQQACFIFGCLGLLGAVWLLSEILHSCFPNIPYCAVVVGTLCVGLVPVVPIVLERPDVWEVPVMASYAFWMISLAILWKTLERDPKDLVVASLLSLMVGLAVGCRPNGAFGAIILLVPFWRVARQPLSLNRAKDCCLTALALAIPIVTIGVCLLSYNYARFGSIYEFGQSFQLNGDTVREKQNFQARFFWYNFRLYFLQMPIWQRHFPFVKGFVIPAQPLGHTNVEHTIGVLALLPYTICSIAIPYVISTMELATRKRLLVIVGVLSAMFVSNAGLFCFFLGASIRYQTEFVPALVLLATIGFFGIEMSRPKRGPWIRILRALAYLSAAVSIAFNLLAATKMRAGTDLYQARVAMSRGELVRAEDLYRHSLRLAPFELKTMIGLTLALIDDGKLDDALNEAGKIVDVFPESADAHFALAYSFLKLGRLDQATEQCKQTLRLRPDFSPARRALLSIKISRANSF